MPKTDIKVRILAVEHILLEAEKPLSCEEIEDKLYADYRIEVNRKTLYDDINAVAAFYAVRFINKTGYWIEKEE